MDSAELERGAALLAAVDTPWEPLTAQRRYDAVLATWLYRHRTDLIASARQAQDNAKVVEAAKSLRADVGRVVVPRSSDGYGPFYGDNWKSAMDFDAAIAAATPGKGEA